MACREPVAQGAADLDAQDGLLDALTDTPATAFAGWQAKARVALMEDFNTGGDMRPAMFSLAEDLLADDPAFRTRLDAMWAERNRKTTELEAEGERLNATRLTREAVERAEREERYNNPSVERAERMVESRRESIRLMLGMLCGDHTTLRAARLAAGLAA